MAEHRNRSLSAALIAVAAISTLSMAIWTSPPQSQQSAQAKPARLRTSYGKLPLSFEENRGQTDPAVKFLARGHGYTLFLTPTDAVLKLRAPSSATSAVRASSGIMPVRLARESGAISAVRIRLQDANPNPAAIGMQPLPGKANYLIGNNASRWHQKVPTFSAVQFREIYPGIDLIYRGAEGRLEYDFTLAPGADPNRIRLHVDGADSLALDGDGNLVIKTAGGDIVEKAPRSTRKSRVRSSR